MFTVIIPTLWLSKRIEKLINDLTACYFVGEIIIIDNDWKNRPNINISLEKVTIISMNENIFVNPAWNLGVEKAKNNMICICNDDVNFNTSIFEFMQTQLPMFEGVIGQDWLNYNRIEDTKFELQDFKMRPHGWGCLLFLNKRFYKPIPNVLKIACGDDYLAAMMQPAKILSGLKIDTEMSTSCSKGNFYLLCDEDLKNFKELMNQN